MGSKKAAMASTAALLLSLNLLFSTIVTSQQEPSSCTMNTIRISDCVTALNNTIGIGGPSPGSPCCSTLGGLGPGVTAAHCLCTAIRTGPVPVVPNNTAAIDAILSACELGITPGFQCPN